MVLEVFAPESLDVSRVICQSESDVRVLVSGSDDFFEHFEGLRGRRRAKIVVQEGDTWDKIAKRYDLSPGQLERINQRSRSDRLSPNDTLVVYAPVGQKIARPASATAAATEPIPLEPQVAPNPEDLPALPEALLGKRSADTAKASSGSDVPKAPSAGAPAP
jgi:membrane-bound lytic murein transglycosylase D